MTFSSRCGCSRLYISAILRLRSSPSEAVPGEREGREKKDHQLSNSISCSLTKLSTVCQHFIMERGSREMMVSCCLRPRLLVSLFAHWKGPLRSLKYSKRCCVKFMSRSTFCKLLCFHVQKFYWTKNMKVEGIMCFTAGVMVNCFFRSQNF